MYSFKYGSESNRGNVFDTEFECSEFCGRSQPDHEVQGSGAAEDGQGLDRDGRQLSPDEAASVCRQPPVIGPCKAAFIRWNFDYEEGVCKEFLFGGCGGNENNFLSEAECRKTCRSFVPRRRNFQRSSFSLESDEANSILTDDVISKLITTENDPCSQPISSGRCYAAFPMFAYNSATGACEGLIYGGCGGNGNRFGSLEECKSICVNLNSETIARVRRWVANECLGPGTTSSLFLQQIGHSSRKACKMVSCRSGVVTVDDYPNCHSAASD